MPRTPDASPESYTVGELARRFRLSRTTLLYYHRLGLLVPSSRSPSRYRRYSAKDAERLAQICRYREAGLTLAAIRRALDTSEQALTQALEQRLVQLATEIERLRAQQRFIVGILKGEAYAHAGGVMTKERWTELLRASGFSDDDMHRWHAEFERASPDEHQRFLEFLCIPAAQVARIRAWSARYVARESVARS